MMKSTITGSTRLVALIGSPISHSRSPQLQNAAFERLGLDFAYLAFDVGVAGIEDALSALRLFNARGANVTMPLKRAVCPHLDALTPVARMAGAVNTIVNENGALIGHITDGAGYLMSLQDAGVSYVNKRMTIVGAGGAASAVAIEAAMAGVAKISVFNLQDSFYTEGQRCMASLSKEFGCDARIFDLADRELLRREMLASDIFANGTPVGMGSSSAESPVPDVSFFHPELVVTDMIYNPAETALLKMATAVGCKTVGGLGMQIHQGALSFELWTGQRMPVEVIRAMSAR